MFVGAEDAAALAAVDFAELAITSGIEIVVAAPPSDAFASEDAPGVGVAPKLAQGQKCVRCWQVLPEVGEQPEAPDLCRRCADTVDALAAA